MSCRIVYGESLLLHGVEHFTRKENFITLPFCIPMSFSVLKIILVFSPQDADNTGNGSEKGAKDDQRSRTCSVSTPLLYISAVCSFASLLLKLKGEKNKNGKRKRMETCKIMSSI